MRDNSFVAPSRLQQAGVLRSKKDLQKVLLDGQYNKAGTTPKRTPLTHFTPRRQAYTRLVCNYLQAFLECVAQIMASIV
jgi:hypothetical protein